MRFYYLHQSCVKIIEKKLFLKMLKYIGPNIEPGGTPDSNISKALWVLIYFDILFTPL